jgi:hypothetical protein
MSRIIECQVNDEYVLGSGVVIGAAGSYGDVMLRLKFNEMWDGLAIIATFRDALRQRSAVVSLLPSMRAVTEDGSLAYLVKIPAEAKRLPGKATLTLSGYINAVMQTNDAGEISYSVEEEGLTNTVTTYFRVSKSDSAVDEDTSVTPTLAAQVVAELNLMHQLRESTNERLLGAEEALDAYGKAEEQRAANETARVEAETQRQEAEEQRNKTIGDIHTALDAIIAIQENLTGIISFFIDGEMYKADEGMTWGEWVDSGYNTIGAEVSSGGLYTIMLGNRIITKADTGAWCAAHIAIIPDCNYATIV